MKAQGYKGTKVQRHKGTETRRVRTNSWPCHASAFVRVHSSRRSRAEPDRRFQILGASAMPVVCHLRPQASLPI